MQIGVVYPQTELPADPGAVRAYVEAVEDLGYCHVLAYDHVVGADPAAYPGWSGPYDIDTTFHEPLVFGFLAGLSALELVTGIIIAPQRQTALLAKQAAEVDILTEGKFRLGLGIGWNWVEYEALGQDFATRGRREEEQVALLRTLWTERSVSYQGRFDKVTGAGLAPRPVQRLESCFFPSMEESWFRELKAQLDDYGLDRVYAWGHPTGLEDGTNRSALEDMVTQVGYAHLIGAKVMRVTPGPGPGSRRYEPRQPRLEVLAGWFQEAVREAGPRGIRLAAENHGDYTAKEMLWLVEAVGSPYFGVNFDTGNFQRLLDDPVGAMEKLAKHVFATHVKDLKVRRGVSPAEWFFFSSTPIGEGLVDMGRIVRLLAEAGYEGLLAVEIGHLHPDYEYDEHLAVRQSIGELRRVVATQERGTVGNANVLAS